MWELSITKIKHYKNDTATYEYSSLDNLLDELKKFIEDKKIFNNDIIRIVKK